MELITKVPRGTSDVLPSESYKWQYIEDIARQTAKAFLYKEVRFPVFEHTELFERGIGDSTDVVQKEMYTFLDKGNRSVTLRPEGTASAVRLMFESGLYGGVLPLKFFYFVPCFRYEKPQAGRLREHHQFGIELFGASDPSSDAEVIALANQFFTNLNIKDISLEINSIGCPDCRKIYYTALNKYFDSKKDKLCPSCLERLSRNPMRVLDCKNPDCIEICKDAPLVIEYICENCSLHFEGVKGYLDAMDIKYKVNPHIVRGLDYYNKTVFEFVSDKIGKTVCGGGRYDGLSEIIGGEKIDGLGFGIGLERIILLLNKEQIPPDNKCMLYAANAGKEGALEAIKLVNILRAKGISSEYDIIGRSLKSQMKYADKIGAKFTIVIGENEVKSNSAVLKNMETGEEITIKLDEILQYIK